MIKNIADKFNNLLQSYKGFSDFKKIPKDKREIVLYSETKADWTFFDEIYNKLIIMGINPIIVTSDINDSILKKKNSFYIGSESVLTIFFKTLDCKIMLMTLTDLDNFHLKKSINLVHYFYIFHSIGSTHRMYREKAFDSYDTILCVGEHHIKEIRKREKMFNLNKKELCQLGYVKLDNLIAKNNNENKKINKKNFCNILIAPSWGKSALSFKNLENIINSLINKDYYLTLRLHPMTLKKNKNIKNIFNKKYIGTNKFYFDDKTDSIDSFINCDILISDWSGAAIEFSFAKLIPVIFVDTLPKTNNPNWKKLDLQCFEDYIREKIGYTISVDDIENLPSLLKEIFVDINNWKEKIFILRNQSIFNIGKSGEIGAKFIFEKLKEINDQTIDK